MASPKFPLTIAEQGVSVRIYRNRETKRAKSGARRRYESYELRWYVAGELRRQRFADLSEARERAHQVLPALINGRTRASAVTDGEIETLHAAASIASKIGAPLLAVLEEHAAAHNLLKGRTTLLGAAEFWRKHCAVDVESRQCADVVEDFLAAKQAEGCSRDYLQPLGVRLRAFGRAFQCGMPEVSSVALGEWLREVSRSPADFNHRLAALGTLFRFAQERGWLSRASAVAPAQISRQRAKNTAPVEIFTPAELRRFLNGDPENGVGPIAKQHALPLALGCFAGLRPKEIQRLEWRDVRQEECIIEVRAAAAKTAARRIVPISENLAALLKTYVGSRGPVCKTRRLATRLMERAARLEMKWPKNGPRHSFASYRLARSKNVAEVSLELGNSPPVVFRHYREAVTTAAADAWWSIELI